MKRKLVIVDPSLRNFVGHSYEYDRSICLAATEANLDPITLGHNDALPQIAEGLPFRGAFTHDTWTPYPEEQSLSREAAAKVSNDRFHHELASAIEALSLPAGTVIFGHMIAWRQLYAWAKFALQVATVKDFEIVILLRYQPEFYSDPHSARAFQMLERAATTTRVRIVTDSYRLSSQISRLTSLPVGVVPIPHIPELESAPSPKVRSDAPLRVVSLGNARDEKGILELIQAIHILDVTGHGRKFHFELQVNDPTKGMAAGIDAFAERADTNVTLHRDALDSHAYYTVLKDADLVVLPYWRSVYEARTSGIFLEAIASGTPILCTADTWMSDELVHHGAGLLVQSTDAADLARQLLNAHRNFAELKSKAEACKERIRTTFNPQAALNAILTNDPPAASVGGRLRAVVLYPWGDALRAHSGASLRSNLLARFLAENGADVRFLQNSADRPETRGAIHFESYSVDKAIKASRISEWTTSAASKVFGVEEEQDLFLRMYLQPEWDAAFTERLNEIIRWADVVFLEYSFWGPRVAKLCRRHGKRLVMTAHDVLSSQITNGPLRWVTQKFEKRAMHAAPTRYAVSESDQTSFAAMGVATDVIRHPIDVASMRIPSPPGTRKLLARMIGAPENTDHYFLFVGSSYVPNVAAAKSLREIAAEYQKLHPDDRVCFIVAGGCLAAEKRANFIALGRVSDLTLRLLYEHASAAIVPLRAGSGASLKTIEAFGAGRTVVGTSLAFRGLPVRNEVECLIEETDAALVAAIARLVHEDPLLERLSASARIAGNQADFHRAFSKYGDHLPADRRSHALNPAGDSQLAQTVSHYLALAAAAVANGFDELAKDVLQNVIELAPENGLAMMRLAQMNAPAAQTDSSRAAFESALLHGAPIVECLRARVDQKRRAGHPVEDDVTRISQIFQLQILSRETAFNAAARLWDDFQAGERRWIVDLIGPVLAQQPDYPDPRFWYLHAHSLLDIGGDMAMAARHFQRASDLGSNPMWSNFHRSRALDRSGLIHEAVAAMIISASAAKPDQADPLRDTGIDLLWKSFHANLYTATLDLAHALLKLGIDPPQLYFLIGESLRRSGQDNAQSLAAFQKAGEGNHTAFWSLMSEGAVCDLEGDAEGAKTHFLKAYAEARNASTSKVARAHAAPEIKAAIAEKRIADVESIYRILIEACPNDGGLHYALAEFYNGPAREFHGAIEQYSFAEKFGIDAFWCCFNRARAYDSVAQPQSAMIDFTGASKFANTDHKRTILAPHLARISRSAFGSRDYDATVRTAAAWSLVDSTNGAAHYLLAESLLIQNQQLDIAEMHYTRALETGHNAYWVHFNRAQLYRRLSRLEEAAADLLVAIDLAPKENRDAETAGAACDLARDLKNKKAFVMAEVVLQKALTVSDATRVSDLLAEIRACMNNDAPATPAAPV